MQKKQLNISYQVYQSKDELPAEWASLLQRATEATERSYAPYSNFNVGAAILLDNGEVVCGSNQENAAYPSGLCAERSACYYAGAAFPGARMLAIAVAARQDGKLTETPTYPCGACRQALVQYENRGGVPMTVIVGSATRIEVFDSVKDLLPFAFDNLDESVMI
ncbi:MAG: cytidine deaminase [Bacteroidales bacterium]|nr:cytidine deaminase [Bacteroidales bacterium]